MRRRKTTTILFAALSLIFFMPGCESADSTTATLSDGSEVSIENQTIGMIEQLREEIRKAQEQLAQQQTDEQRAETEAAIAAMEAKVFEKINDMAGKLGSTPEQIEAIVTQVITAWNDPNVNPVEGTITATAPLLPPPFDVISIALIPLVGELTRRFGKRQGRSAGRAEGEGIAKTIVKNVAASMHTLEESGGTHMNMEKLRDLNVGTGVQDFVKLHK